MNREQDPEQDREQDREQAPRAGTGPAVGTGEVTPVTAGLLTKPPAAGAHSPGARSDRPHRTHRPWSARRIPAALTALVIGAGAAALLVDVANVRAGRSAAAWRTRLAGELASRPLDDHWIRIGAGVLALLGLWLIFLAVTPGLRRHLPLRTPGPGLRAVLDRRAAENLLRDAALRVPGVSGVRVRLGRHRLRARADVRFRDPPQVRSDLLTALNEELGRLALARPRSLAVRVRPLRK
ncbi:DUF6286 domain-containing protein [Streptomyces sp. NPDC012888]|uniref:DUF6286 domain-containing protein n=1 Tax=Streptomyces sp. NPDC012888 TaxID=3364855 RepID=UPI0036A84E11